jgi:hypothetical protein
MGTLNKVKSMAAAGLSRAIKDTTALGRAGDKINNKIKNVVVRSISKVKQKAASYLRK